MRRYLYALLGMSLLASVNGCVTTAVGGGSSAAAGTYSYFSRNLEVIYGVPLADVWPRALAAVESLQLHIDRQRIDGLGGEIQARRPNGTRVQVCLKPTGDHSTSVSVRIGFWGDREMSERVQRTIRQQVGI
jgi:Protein of unknown function (DUF3568)